MHDLAGGRSSSKSPHCAMSQTMSEKPYTHSRQAYLLGILNGVLFNIGVAFIDPSTVLPAFVARISHSDLAVGFVAAIANGGWYLPQLYGASHVQSRPYKRPMYVFTTCLRVSAWVLIVPITFFVAPMYPIPALVAFMCCYSLDAFGGGLAGPAFLDIVAKTVSPARLGAFFANRAFWGGLGAIGAGMLVRVILGSGGPRFPYGYCLLFSLALVMFLPGWLLFMRIKEPPGRVAEDQSLMGFLRSAPDVIRLNHDYRLLLIGRLFLGAVGVAIPFYIIYCQRVLGAPDSAVGTYLALQMAGSVVANPFWALLNDRRGPRSLILASTLAVVAYAVAAALASFFPHATWFGRASFGVVFFLLAAAGSGGFIGCTNYLLAISPEEQRPLYIGVQNTLFAVTTFLPLLGGVLLRFGSFQLVFGLAAAFGVAGLITVLRLPPSEQAA
jgi:MFS family permease